MSFFSKVKGSAASFASKSLQILSNVKSAAVDLATNTPGQSAILPPPKEMEQLFQAIYDIIDTLANSPEPYSIASDQRLQESKLKPHINRIVKLLRMEAESGAFFISNASAHSNDEPDLVQMMPCIDLFLSSHFLSELINRALHDRPRGCLPLILTITAHLLKCIKYPLLPHQSIYKPISKLISNAMRYDAIHNNAVSICSGGAYNKVEYSTYKRRIDFALTSLLTIIWRKIYDNPPVLEFFIVSDSNIRRTAFDGKRRQSIDSPNRFNSALSQGGVKLASQMDIITSLVNSIQAQKSSQYAQEAFYIALYLNHSSINSYVLFNTNTVLFLINDVCKKYVTASDYATQWFATQQMNQSGSSSGVIQSVSTTPQNVKSPYTLGQSNSSVAASTQNINTPNNLTTSSLSVVNPVEAFIQYFRLCVHIYSILLYNLTHTRRQADRYNPCSPRDNSAEGGDSARGIQLLVEHYSGYFLHGALHQTLQNKSETASIACHALLTGILLELRAVEAVNSDRGGCGGGGCGGGGGGGGGGGCGSGGLLETPSLLEVTLDFLYGTPSSVVSSSTSTMSVTSTSTTVTPGSNTSNNNQYSLTNTATSTVTTGATADTSNTDTNNSSSATKTNTNYTILLLSRIGSMNKTLAVSSYQLIATMLAISPLSFAVDLMNMAKPSRGGTTTAAAAVVSGAIEVSLTPFNSPLPQNHNNSTTAFKNYQSTHNLVANYCSTVQSQIGLSLADLLADVLPVSLPVGAAAAATVMSPAVVKSQARQTAGAVTPLTSNVPTTPSTASAVLATPATIKREVNSTDRTGNNTTANLVQFYRCVDAAATHILYRLSGHLSEMISPAGVSEINSSFGSKSPFSRPEKSSSTDKSLVFQIIAKKLSTFLTLKSEEQIALSSIMKQFVALSCITMISGSNYSDNTTAFNQVVDLLKSLDSLWVSIKTHLSKIPQVVNKLAVMKRLLNETSIQRISDLKRNNNCSDTISNNSSHSGVHNSSLHRTPSHSQMNLNNNTNNNTNNSSTMNELRKYLVKDSTQVKTILETSVYIRELVTEIRAYLFATKLLSNQLNSNNNNNRIRQGGFSVGQSASRGGCSGGGLLSDFELETVHGTEGGDGAPMIDVDGMLLLDDNGDVTDTEEPDEEFLEDSTDIRNMKTLLQTGTYDSTGEVPLRKSNNSRSGPTSQRRKDRSNSFEDVDDDDNSNNNNNKEESGDILSVTKGLSASLSDVCLYGGYTGTNKRLIYWCNLESKESEFLSEYETVCGQIDALVATTTTGSL